MKPLNQNTRNDLYLKFLLFFFLTSALVVLAIFVDVQLPTQENKILKAKYAQINKELEFQSGFTKKVNEVRSILDSINNSGQNVMYLEQLASTKLAGMKESIPVEDSIKQKALYDYMIQTLIALQNSKKNLRDFKENQAALKQYELNIQKYKEELDNTKRDLDICRQLSVR